MGSKTIILWGVALLNFIVINAMIAQKEGVKMGGETIFFELAPRDPRSLMQGDYMVLRYAITRNIQRKMHYKGQSNNDFNAIVIRVDKRKVAQFVRVHSNKKPLKFGEQLLRCQKKGEEILLGAESFFFQEGHAKDYQNARFGEIKVSANGDSVLVGLRDKNLKEIKPRKK